MFKVSGREVEVCEPATIDQGGSPLILFSHGLGGCRLQSTFLMEALRAEGYWVVAPDHADASKTCPPTSVAEVMAAALAGATGGFGTKIGDRGTDLREVLAALKNEPALAAKINWTRVALAGHSLGGATVLALAGANDPLDGLCGVLAMAPFVAPVMPFLADISVPVMLHFGKKDKLAEFLGNPTDAFGRLNSPAMLAQYNDAGHFSWTDLDKDLELPITASANDFLGHVLQGAALTWTPASGVGSLIQK